MSIEDKSALKLDINALHLNSMIAYLFYPSLSSNIELDLTLFLSQIFPSLPLLSYLK